MLLLKDERVFSPGGVPVLPGHEVRRRHLLVPDAAAVDRTPRGAQRRPAAGGRVTGVDDRRPGLHVSRRTSHGGHRPYDDDDRFRQPAAALSRRAVTWRGHVIRWSRDQSSRHAAIVS